MAYRVTRGFGQVDERYCGRLVVQRLGVFRVARLRPFLLFLAIGVTAGLLFNNGCGGASSTPAVVNAKIQHVVVIFQENRSTDNLFHDPNLIAAGADIANYGYNSAGQKIPLVPWPLATNFDLSHTHSSFLAMYDGGNMDGADKIPITCQKTATDCPPPNTQFMYVQPSDVQPYFQLAEQYTFADRMFQTNQGPSFPAHQFIISGTSAPAVGSNLFAAENPAPFGSLAGCIAAAGTTVNLIDPNGNETPAYPCYEHPTLTDLLDAQKISWRYYAPQPGSIWTGPDAIKHMCQPQTQNGQLVCTGRIWNNVIVPPPANRNEKQVLTDIASGNLAQVTWVIPGAPESDHATENNGSGPSWVAAVVNAIGNSQYWSDTAILIAWDDWGGWYDHVPPRVINSYEYGFRVPLIVVSPYAKAHYISHVTHDFGSILKFIETVYGLPSLGYADAPADDLSDCFDFNQAPLSFQTISAPLSASDFLLDTRPEDGPDDD